MSTNHEVTRERQPVAPPQDVPPEVPRRPRSTLQGSRSARIGRSTTPQTHQHHPRHPPQPAVREIHKNAWLKRIVPGDKKGAPFVKKYDKLWVVFCVHDDVEAFLEFYSDPKLGVSHRPNAYISLNSCLHVSPSIVGQENDEYQFAVTLSTQVIRLVAANWDQMIEWVESLQGKLREMNILSPKDNLYSKLPETRGTGLTCLPGYFSSRDPNSPLPPTPTTTANGPSFSVEPPPFNLMLVTHDVEGNRQHGQNVSRPSQNGSMVISAGPVTLLNENYGTAVTTAYTQPSSRDGSGSDSGLGSGGSVMSSISEPITGVTVFPISVGSISTSVRSPFDASQQNGVVEPMTAPRSPSPSVSVVTGNNNNTRLQVGSDENETFLNTVSEPHITPSSNSSSPSAVPVYSQPQPRKKQTQPKPEEIPTDQDPRLKSRAKNHNDVIARQLSAPARPNSTPSENVYEYLFTPDEPETNGSGSAPNSGQRNPNNNSRVESAEAPPLVPRRQFRRLCSNTHRSSSLNRLEEQNDGRNDSVNFRRNQNDSQQNPSRSNNGPMARSHKEFSRRAQVIGTDNSFIHIHGLQGEPMEALIGVKSGEYRIRREEVIPASHPNENDPNSDGPRPVPHGGHLMSHVPLKEQQVMRLRAEMTHPGGVRVVLRKKDCVNSIGFVDYLGAVWIAGWKQQQHPVLYYAFHVGDQILKVAGVAVQNSVEATRAIKMASNLQVEFVIRRVPQGNVFVLKRSREGEPLGLVAINNTPEIGEVLPDGLAASQGLPPSCRGTDGLSNCTWFLTEVNNRPLSLLARENEVRDRLNAVGKEISILVQPSDLVKHLKKQLKTMKGFKDYLVV